MQQHNKEVVVEKEKVVILLIKVLVNHNPLTKIVE